jgi:tRNA 2-selenouridine synthase
LPTFENALAAEVLRHRNVFALLEDESRTIGRIGIPEQVHRIMQTAPVVQLETEMPARIAAIRAEYVDAALHEMDEVALHARFRSALARIRRRLGGQRHQEILEELASGFEHGEHERWIERLLTWYYDPMYDYQLEKKQARIRFTGPAAAVKSFLDAQRPFPS